MLNEIIRLVSARLITKKVPSTYRVVYGPEREVGSIIDTRIVFEYDRNRQDSFGGPVATHLNPTMKLAHEVSFVCRIFAQSTATGATQYEHEELALQILDKVLCALINVIRGTLKGSLTIISGKFLSTEELEMAGMEQWPAAAYEMQFSVTRSVFDTDWTCAKAAEASIGEGGTGEFIQTTQVHRLGSTVMESPDGKAT